MEGSKCVISIKTHDLVTYKDTNLPVIDNDFVLLYNKEANCVIRMPLTKTIRDMFKIGDLEVVNLETEEKEGHNHTVQEDYHPSVEEVEIMGKETSIEKSMKQGDETLTELLISEYANRPPLYNEKLPIIERSRSIKKALELEVYNALGGQISLEDIPKKWNYLKKEYKKQKILFNKYIQSGCSYEEAAKITGKTLWKHFLSMRFIDDHIDDRKRVTNIPEPLESPIGTSCSSNDIFSPPQSPQLQSSVQITASTSSTPTTVEFARGVGNERRIIQDTNNLDQLIAEEIKKNAMDSTDHFCRVLACEMKKLDDRKRALLQIKFLELLNTELCDI